MFRLYSKGCEYALRALSTVSLAEHGKGFSARMICRKARIPEPFARKALQALSRAGFLKAVTGPGGGYVLSRHPKDISILDIIKAVDGKHTFDHCVMGLPRCDHRKPCLIHHTWGKVKGELLAQLKNKSLDQLMKTV